MKPCVRIWPWLYLLGTCAVPWSCLSDNADMKGCLTTYRDMSSGQESSTTRRAIGSDGVM